MIICLPTDEGNIDSLLSEKLEKAKYLIFVEESGVVNKCISLRKKDDILFSITGNKAEVVITGNLSAENFDFLRASGIKVYAGVFGITAREALGRFKRGELREPKEEVSGVIKGRIV